ncbi:hypothetical protein [Methylocapsa acidiphila]|uniref:hypothetical protein n=1 Tax=Methylocapsa acidiphila TaxID=133552 RepID=UPI00047A3580|nr:hypothetical protein [Methylocapsa acidiphila]
MHERFERAQILGERAPLQCVEIAFASFGTHGDRQVAAATEAYDVVRAQAFDTVSIDKDSSAHFLHPSRFAPRFQPAADYARASLSRGRPILEGAIELMQRIKADFKYDAKATVVSTPIWPYAPDAPDEFVDVVLAEVVDATLVVALAFAASAK